MAEIPHVVDVAGAHAFLHVGKSGARGMFGAQQIRHQRVHARGGKQHGRIVFRDQRCAGDNGVPLILKKLEKHRTQFGGGSGLHEYSLLTFSAVAGNVRYGARIARHNNILYKKKAKSVNISGVFMRAKAVFRRLSAR